MHARRRIQVGILAVILLAFFLVFQTRLRSLEATWESLKDYSSPSYCEAAEEQVLEPGAVDVAPSPDCEPVIAATDITAKSSYLSDTTSPTPMSREVVVSGTEFTALPETEPAAATIVPSISYASTSQSSVPDKVVVMGRLQTENTSWVQDELPDWQSAVYVVDGENTTGLHTPINKGREALPYLTYLVDCYESLPSTIAFLHAHRGGYPRAWHNEGDGYDAVAMLRALNIDFIQRNGYANLRCIAIPGCPDEIRPFRTPREKHRTAEHAMARAWKELFNDIQVPDILATPCCGQFAVSRDQVLKRPRSEYKKFRDWAMRTSLDDDTSGRVFEYLWHIIFGQDPVYCPELGRCYCDVYGRC